MVDCSIEHLINITFENVGGTLMHILQHQDLHIIPSSVLRVGAVPNECLPTFSTEVSKGNSGSEAGEGQHIYFK